QGRLDAGALRPQDAPRDRRVDAHAGAGGVGLPSAFDLGGPRSVMRPGGLPWPSDVSRDGRSCRLPTLPDRPSPSSPAFFSSLAPALAPLPFPETIASTCSSSMDVWSTGPGLLGSGATSASKGTGLHRSAI